MRESFILRRREFTLWNNRLKIQRTTFPVRLAFSHCTSLAIFPTLIETVCFSCNEHVQYSTFNLTWPNVQLECRCFIGTSTSLYSRVNRQIHLMFSFLSTIAPVLASNGQTIPNLTSTCATCTMTEANLSLIHRRNRRM